MKGPVAPTVGRVASTIGRVVAIGRAVAIGALLAGTLAISLRVPPTALAATPPPTPDAGGDTRSAGEGPGLVGAPILAIGGVVLLGIVSAGLTVAYVRATATRRPLATTPDLASRQASEALTGSSPSPAPDGSDEPRAGTRAGPA
jgi:hypothetical protein